MTMTAKAHSVPSSMVTHMMDTMMATYMPSAEAHPNSMTVVVKGSVMHAVNSAVVTSISWTISHSVNTASHYKNYCLLSAIRSIYTQPSQHIRSLSFPHQNIPSPPKSKSTLHHLPQFAYFFNNRNYNKKQIIKKLDRGLPKISPLSSKAQT
jgi:hypothetical protein